MSTPRVLAYLAILSLPLAARLAVVWAVIKDRRH